jgi:hypothetical protein
LLLSRRRQYHAEIARTVESRFPDIAEIHPELIARHYTEAAAPEQAMPYWVKAGQRALARFAFREPAAHFERGLELARALPEGPQRSRRILGLLLLLGDAQLRSQEREALAIFAEAAEVARAQGSPEDFARAALGVEESELYKDVVGDSAGLLNEALAALGGDETTLRCRVLSHLGRASFKLGASERASAMMHEATSLARRLGDPRALFDALHCEHITTAGQPCLRRSIAYHSLASSVVTSGEGIVTLMGAGRNDLAERGWRDEPVTRPARENRAGRAGCGRCRSTAAGGRGGNCRADGRRATVH